VQKRGEEKVVHVHEDSGRGPQSDPEGKFKGRNPEVEPCRSHGQGRHGGVGFREHGHVFERGFLSLPRE
ncbi:MAG: hypothetical protein SVQ76_01505, partial [Candidatus Nanohaloarchaea archaeon]|nr:hypothetical protein [Candidatus Nanohaloarchaea archaeon]